VGWCAGTFAFGIGAILFALRASLTSPMLALASAIVLASYPAQVGALELEMNRDPRWRRKAWLFGETIACF